MNKLLPILALLFFSCDIPAGPDFDPNFEWIDSTPEWQCDPDEPPPDLYSPFGFLHPDCNCLTYMIPDGFDGMECNWDATTTDE